MPMHEYECEACGSEVERFEMIPQEPPPVCECGQEKMRKLISSGIINMDGMSFGVRLGKSMTIPTDSLEKEYSKYPDIVKEG